METEHRRRLLDILTRIPSGVPTGWERETFAVGGLMYIGFSNVETEKLVVISTQGQSVINCRTREKVFGPEYYDELGLTACAESLGDELVPIAGVGGGGLRRFAPNGDTLELVAPFWPEEQVIFMPKYASWYQKPESCMVLFEDYSVFAYGFSRCGNYMAVAAPSGLDIFTRVGV